MSCINLFNLVISSSIKGSFIILCILFLKFIFKNHFGAKWHYLIWFILIIRLMMPYSPNSPVSLFNLMQIFDQTPALEAGELETYINPIQISFGEEQWLEETATKNYVLETMRVLSWIWAIGAIIILTYTFGANIQFLRKWRKNAIEAECEVYKLLEKCKLTMGINKKIPIFYTNQIKAPVLFGLMHPYLLLPEGLKNALNKDELTCIMLHELAHLKRKDIATFWIMALLKAVHWMNPIIWYALNRMRQDCEVACDALTLSYMNEKDNKKYGYTIIQMLQKNKPIAVASMAGVTGNKSQIVRRLKMIAQFKKNSYKLSFVSIAILVVMGCMFLTNAEEEKTEPQAQAAQPEVVEAEEIQAENPDMLWPLPLEYNKITSPYGWRTHPVLKEKMLHPGIDIAAPLDVEVMAAQKGTVIVSEWDDGYGNMVKIQHDNGIVTFYAHCNELKVSEGDTVEAGDIIALVGSTGASTGPHLHFEIQKDGEPIDPIGEYLKVTTE